MGYYNSGSVGPVNAFRSPYRTAAVGTLDPRYQKRGKGIEDEDPFKKKRPHSGYMIAGPVGMMPSPPVMPEPQPPQEEWDDELRRIWEEIMKGRGGFGKPPMPPSEGPWGGGEPGGGDFYEE